MRYRLAVAFDGLLPKLGLVLTASLLTSLSLIAGPVVPTRAAILRPHAASTCSQPGGVFLYGSAVVGIAGTPDDGGYWIVNNAGQVAACGDATYLGQPATLNKPIVGIAATPDAHGYYLVASDGGIFAYGDAVFQGSTGSLTLNKPIVGMAVDSATGGYWLVASDGGIFAYNAPFLGSTGSITLNRPVVGMAAAPNGSGYWFVASDGGIFAYGVPFYGSTGSITLNKPVVGMAVDPANGGYWLVASDGGIFAYNAPFYGSTGSIVLNKPIVGMEASPSGAGYRFVAADGGVFAYNSQFYGTPAFAAPPASPPTPVDLCHQNGITYCVLNPAVTQATIDSTICVSGWTATVRPPVSYTEALKASQIAAEGLPGGLSAYEEDHRMPLELGGSPADPHNLSPEPPPSPNPKDSDENSLNSQVCDGQLTLAQAQQQMVTKWLLAWPGYKQ